MADNSDHDSGTSLDFRWHLAGDEVEVASTELEFALMRAFEGFGRWQSECLAVVCDLAASGPENVILHIIRMNDRPKSIKDLSRLTNREDIPNMQYALRKLMKAGLVAKRGAGRTGVTYEITDAGRKVTDDYSIIRQRLLIEEIRNIPGYPDRLTDAVRTLNILSGLYEQVSRVAATHRKHTSD